MIQGKTLQYNYEEVVCVRYCCNSSVSQVELGVQLYFLIILCVKFEIDKRLNADVWFQGISRNIYFFSINIY